MLINKSGYFISFEGIDGCGKTTQIKKLKSKLIKKKIDNILITREPGGEKNAEKIRTIILQQKNMGLVPVKLVILSGWRLVLDRSLAMLLGIQ